MDIFHGCFKDNTNGTFDPRFVSSFYLILRVILLLSLLGCSSVTFYGSCSSIATFIFVFLFLLFFALVRPYKVQHMNTYDSLLLAGLSLISFLLIINMKYSKFSHIILSLVLLIIVIPQVVLYGYFLYKILKLLFRIHFFNTFAVGVKKVLRSAAMEQPVETISVERELSESFLN